MSGQQSHTHKRHAGSSLGNIRQLANPALGGIEEHPEDQDLQRSMSALSVYSSDPVPPGAQVPRETRESSSPLPSDEVDTPETVALAPRAQEYINRVHYSVRPHVQILWDILRGELNSLAKEKEHFEAQAQQFHSQLLDSQFEAAIANTRHLSSEYSAQGPPALEQEGLTSKGKEKDTGVLGSELSLLEAVFATQQGTQDFRAQANQEIADDAEALIGLNVPSADSKALADLPADWMKNKLQSKRHTATEQAHPRGSLLGCWMTRPEPSNDPAYPKYQLKKTPHPTREGEKVGVNVSLAKCAIVAGGRGADLLATSKAKEGEIAHRNISHLCHNSKCFNPDHVWVETAIANNARKSCSLSMNTQCSCRNIFKPCPHRQLEGGCGRECLLPTAIIPEDPEGKAAGFKGNESGTAWVKREG